MDVTVVIPTIPGRGPMLQRAIRSCLAQRLAPVALSIACDTTGEGAGPTRTRAMRAVTTEWLAFLDDDDELDDMHLSRCAEVATETGCDVVVPWFTIVGADGRHREDWNPFPQHRGRQFDPADPHSFPITCLVRTAVTDGLEFPAFHDGDWAGDDFAFWCALGARGAEFVSIPDRTWWWHHHGRNTSGLTTKADRHYAGAT